MINNISEITSDGRYIYNIDQVDDEIEQYNSYEMFPLIAKINRFNNTAQERVEQGMSSSRDRQKGAATKTGWLKRLFSVAAVIAGVGALTTGGYYIVGRALAGSRSDNTILPRLETSLSIPNTLDWHSSTVQPDYQQDVAHFPHASEISNFPYDDIYWDSVVKKSSPPVMTTLVPDSSEDLLTMDKLENVRNAYDNSVNQTNFYPLGYKFHNDLAEFCLADINTIVFKSYKAESEYKCDLLGKIVKKIPHYKDMDTLIRKLNTQREPLTVEDSTEELMTRRKLTTLYLAAETIIGGKDEDIEYFYNNAMADYKNYTSDEIYKREVDIVSYFLIQSATGEC